LVHLSSGDPFQPLAQLAPQATVQRSFDLAYQPSTGLPLLNQAGTLELSALYRDTDHPNSVLLAETIRLTVTEPPPEEQQALADYRNGLAFFAEFDAGTHNATPEQLAAAAAFLDIHRGSIYWKGVRRGLWAALNERVLADVASEWEQDYLRKLTDEWTDDTAAPAIAAVAAPESLWPPNHELVPVAVTVKVCDDQDPDPEIVLESITCDDGCDPSLDVGDALFGMDDREFLLRAERLGSGQGRTYTIRYSATDESGNKSEAATTVVVPHDEPNTARP
jgi:hypothetical protein